MSGLSVMVSHREKLILSEATGAARLTVIGVWKSTFCARKSLDTALRLFPASVEPIVRTWGVMKSASGFVFEVEGNSLRSGVSVSWSGRLSVALGAA